MRSKTWMAALLCSAGLAAAAGCGDDSNSSNPAPAGFAGGGGGVAGSGASAGAGAGGAAGASAGSGGAAAGEGGQAGEGGAGGGAPVVPVIDLRADNNRDGNVDLADDADDLDEDTWDKSHGAVFLANIDDDDNHCPYKASLSDDELAGCHDGTDDIVNGDDDLLDLARLKTAPWADAPDEAVGRLSVSEAAAPYVRLFKNDGSGAFTVFNPATDTLTVDEVRAGVELAIEASDVVRDSKVWDGYADLTFDITNGEEPFEGATPDVVRLRVSPMMTHHHLQPAVRAYVANISGDPGSAAMRADLKDAVKAAGVPQGLLEFKGSSVSNDQWTQDYFETAYMAMPTAEGNHVIRVAYRSANVYNTSGKFPLRPAGRVVFSNLLGKDFGAVQQYDLKHQGAMDSLNSFGNTETIPPYTLDDKSYPLGRLFRGSVKTFYPDKKFAKMLESQQVQPPVYVDTSWLLVGHVDETISFIKVDSPRGWAMVVNDPAMAKKMLEDQVAAGNGDVKMFIGKKWASFDNKPDPDAEISIKDVLADKDVMAESASTAAEVDNQVEILKKETGITDEEIIRLPYLHEPAEGYSLAYQVGTVNGIYLADKHFGSPKPHGPVIDGKDIFEVQMTEAFAKVGVTVHYIEDWDLYHRLSGEVHCGSNVIREVSSEKWWESGY